MSEVLITGRTLHKKNWHVKKTLLGPGDKNIQNTQLVANDKNIMPHLQIEIGLMKNL